MMLYMFVSQNGNVVRLGEDCDVPPQLAEKVAEASAAGYQLATAEEYDQQVLGGASKVPAEGDCSEPAPVMGEAPAEEAAE